MYLSPRAMSHYAAHAFGNIDWLQYKLVQIQQDAPMLAIWIQVDKGTASKVRHQMELKLFRKSHVRFGDAVFVTHHPTQAQLLSQLLLFPQSLHALDCAPVLSHCSRVSKALAAAQPSAPPEVVTDIVLHPESLAVDGPSVLGWYGLHSQEQPAVGLVFDGAATPGSARLALQNSCATGHCQGIRFSDRSSNYLSGTVDDTTVNNLLYSQQSVGYCYGLKFVGLHALASYLKKSTLASDLEEAAAIDSFQCESLH